MTRAAANLRERLSRREWEVFCRASRGGSAAEVALDLGMGERTLETHLLHIRVKLGLDRAADFVRLACHAGLLMPPEEDRLPLAVALAIELGSSERQRLSQALRWLIHSDKRADGVLLGDPQGGTVTAIKPQQNGERGSCGL